MQGFTDILTRSAPWLLLAVGVLTDCRLNLKRVNRVKQMFMPLFALAFCIAAIVLTEYVERIILLIGDLAGSILPAIVELPLWKLIDWSYGLLCLSNAVIMAVWLIIKPLLLGVSRLLCELLGPLFSRVAEPFYSLDEDYHVYVLDKSRVQLREFMKWAFTAGCVTAVTLFFVARFAMKVNLIKYPFYPVMCILVLGEIVFFLGGVTAGEYEDSLFGEGDDSVRRLNYAELRGVFRRLFPDRVLFDNTADQTANGSKKDVSHIIDGLIKSSGDADILLGKYLERRHAAGEALEPNYIHSAEQLLHGKSVLFATPFYNDLTPYVFFPAVRQLFRGKKLLVVLGHDTSVEDAAAWVDSGVSYVTNIPQLFRCAELGCASEEHDAAILPFSRIHDAGLIAEKADFLEKVRFVVLLSPASIVSTSQIGLSLVVRACEKGGSVVYCACDRNHDGLVDTLSHLLKTEMISVAATGSEDNVVSTAIWAADGGFMHHRLFPNVAHYLGVGTEIAAVALNNQVSHVEWLASTRFPLLDMRWIAGQYFRPICSYAGLEPNQRSIDEAVDFIPGLWGSRRERNKFMIVEDEYSNMCELMRQFSTRITQEGFISVICPNYLLRDYMRYNGQLFMKDPKAIPSVVPDFARTPRNVLMRLLLLLRHGEISEDAICRELALADMPREDAASAVRELVERYYTVNGDCMPVACRSVEELERDARSVRTVRYFFLREDSLYSESMQMLQCAYYIAEDDEERKNTLGARLWGHIHQRYLPGQLCTLAGKYYQVCSISKEHGMIVRRAADHLQDRQYYRQIRTYAISKDQNELRRTTSGNITVSLTEADISVETAGYYVLDNAGDIHNARRVERTDIPKRHYRNKQFLRIEMPGCSQRQLCTLAVLLSEAFASIYPDANEYIAVCAFDPEDAEHRVPDSVMYSLDCEEGCLYILEDSPTDLGLLSSIERNLARLYAILSDYLKWHISKLNEPDEPDEPAVPQDGTGTGGDGEAEPQKKKDGFIKRLIERIKRFFKGLFRRKRKGEAEPPETGGDEGAVQPEPAPEAEQGTGVQPEPAPEAEREISVQPEPGEPNADGAQAPCIQIQASVDTSDIPAEEDGGAPKDDIGGEDEVSVRNGGGAKQPPYREAHYLLFGFPVQPEWLDADGTLEYLESEGFTGGALTQARERAEEAEELERTYDPTKKGVHFCDFCGVELTGVEYDALADGRERCCDCSRTAVRSVEDFAAIYKTVHRRMEALFGIRINVGIKVRLTSAREMARRLKRDFKPTPGFDPRAVGLAIRDGNEYTILVENGAPKLSAIGTIAHELTHIWQYTNWDSSLISKQYGKAGSGEVYEGMAMWAEIQYLMLINEPAYAKREEIATRSREDEYGRGFRLYAERYPFSKGTFVTNATPFASTDSKPL